MLLNLDFILDFQISSRVLEFEISLKHYLNMNLNTTRKKKKITFLPDAPSNVKDYFCV